MGYNHVKDIGYKEAETKYTQVIKDYENNVSRKINVIEAISNSLAIESKESSEALAKDVGNILSNTKGKTLTVIKNGECTPSKTFSDSFTEINKRTNQSMKGSDK
jgi:hypothetical protein